MSILMADKRQMMVDVEAALENVRPHLAVDGGNVELIDITDEKIVLIKWLGACKNCNMTQMTLKAGIEEVVRSKVPEIIRVQSIDEVVS
jgi:Fe-S cluster biogenesis protein NfuA